MNDKQINDAGREIERQNADAGLDVEDVLTLHCRTWSTTTTSAATYERSYSGSKNREADAGLIRAAIQADRDSTMEAYAREAVRLNASQAVRQGGTA